MEAIGGEIGRTRRLAIRDWHPNSQSDVDAAYDMYSRPEVARWLGAKPVVCADRDEARARIERLGSLRRGDFGAWAFAESEDLQRPIGTALFLDLPRSDGEVSTQVEIGWHLNPASWGRGFATEVGGWLIERARDAGCDLVHAVVYPDNVKSLAVCDRLGMTRLGPTDEWYGVRLVDHTLSLR